VKEVVSTVAATRRSALRRTGEGTKAGRGEVRRHAADDPKRQKIWFAFLFLLPAAVLLLVYVVYPVCYSLVRSLFDSDGSAFVGLGNYADAFTDANTLTAMKNNVIWVIVAPVVVTSLGLLFAVLTERIRWAIAFRMVLFMPMAISLFASGIIFRLVYQEDPALGVANAAAVTVHDVFAEPSAYPGVRPRDGRVLAATDSGLLSTQLYQPGDVATLPLVGIQPSTLPKAAAAAVQPGPSSQALRGVVWLDVGLSGVHPGAIDHGERGMPGVSVNAVRDGTVVASTTTGEDGTFSFPDVGSGRYQLELPASNFVAPFRGLTWLGPDLVTPVIISCWIWIMTGFAMTFIAAGLAAIPRDALEAARVDGATEWQVFRRVTVPLIGPVLLVVFVTLVINVLKIFELVYVIAPGASQSAANVLALQMWQVSFGAGGGDQGLGSAIGIILFALVIPAMLFNVRRFRRERR
jgi:alpha-glucoside transport system permease protein